jgi:release factor glutamine methyltransferase
VAHTTFSGMALAAQPGRVMTPRPASERLVDAAVSHLAGEAATAVDVGTGSGAIAIALAARAPRVTVWATDTSLEAVALASRNARLHGLDERVLVRQGDLLDPVPGPVDVVVANLPYLPAGDASRRHDLAAEPHAAVFAAGDGLDPYRRLVAICEERLGPDGFVAIQLHRHVLAASRGDLVGLSVRMEAVARAHLTADAELAAAAA